MKKLLCIFLLGIFLSNLQYPIALKSCDLIFSMLKQLEKNS